MTGKFVAIKKLIDPVRVAAKYALRELYLLSGLKHSNVSLATNRSSFHLQLIGLLDAYSPQCSPSDLRDIYIVTEFLENGTLETVAKRLENKKKISHDQLSSVAYQLLLGVRYLHQVGVTHRVSLSKGVRIALFRI